MYEIKEGRTNGRILTEINRVKNKLRDIMGSRNAYDGPADEIIQINEDLDEIIVLYYRLKAK